MTRHSTPRRLTALTILGLVLLPVAAMAQSTHGMHSQQILPIVVDTASFSSRITITSPVLPSTAAAPTIEAYYVPAAGTATSAPLQCNSTVLEHGKTVTYGSLRTLCPYMGQGSNFGYLRLTRRGVKGDPAAFSVNRGFLAYSRVSNPSGIGFSVEAFPENTFGGGPHLVLGARNAAATASTPAYQTNCFVGTFDDFPQGGEVTIRPTSDVGTTGPSMSMTLGPNMLVRVLDVFTATGTQSPAYDNASVLFDATAGATKPAFMAFCTVQDNTSLGADFRIAEPFGYPRSEHVSRRTALTKDALGRGFSLAPGSYQTFFLNFRVPDIVGCELVDPNTQVPLAADNGIELYLRRADGLSATGFSVAGGAGVTAFSNVDLGSKEASEYANPGHLLVVQSTATPAANNINYGLVCRSGSGHSLPHRVAEGSGRVIP